MENNRIQKLLMTEYCEFFDKVLVESPFSETTRNGRGIRQVALGLTSSRLIVAADVLKNNNEFWCPPDLDPSIECFELVSVYPLEYVHLSVFSRRRRRTLKARLIDGRTCYYELGGVQRRKLFWTIWCDHIHYLLISKVGGSSLSETTAASSTSTSTVYRFSSELEIVDGIDKQYKRKVCRLWAHYAGAGGHAAPTWPHKDLYLGAAYNELGSGQYTPVPVRFAGASYKNVRYELQDRTPTNKAGGNPCRSWPTCQTIKNRRKSPRNGGLCEVLFIRDHVRTRGPDDRLIARCECSPSCTVNSNAYVDAWSEMYTDVDKNVTSKVSRCLISKVSRFAFGVPEKCNSGLVLGPYRGCQDDPSFSDPSYKSLDLHWLIENSVTIWEGKEGAARILPARRKHLRRYGLSTSPHFLYALGPWTVQPGERDTVRHRRALSVVNVHRRPIDASLRLPVSRHQLAASISCSALEPRRSNYVGLAAKGRLVLFWTPEYWCRPRAATVVYKELRQHLSLLRKYLQEKERLSKRKLFSRRRNFTKNESDASSALFEAKSSSFLSRILSGISSTKQHKKKIERKCSDTNRLQRLLRMNHRITIWDLDSTTLAEQITLIDRDLFTRIPATEIEILVYQKTSKNAPNLAAWVAFSHRICCLTTSEILAIKTLRMRARIVARFINAADHCLAIGNFHSARSILAGLQAPPIYRLEATWSYLRRHHARRYEIMETLCKIYRNTRSSTYRKAWSKAERNPPFLPYVEDVLTRVLGLYNSKFSDAKERQRLSAKLLPLREACENVIASSNQPRSEPQNFEGTLGKRLTNNQPGPAKWLLVILRRLRFRKPSTMNEERNILLWTPKQQNLARKFFDRWTDVVLESKLRPDVGVMDSRRKLVLDVATWLTDCQKFAHGYQFPDHSFASEFLLRARYREDRENFFISLRLEPPRAMRGALKQNCDLRV